MAVRAYRILSVGIFLVVLGLLLLYLCFIDLSWLSMYDRALMITVAGAIVVVVNLIVLALAGRVRPIYAHFLSDIGHAVALIIVIVAVITMPFMYFVPWFKIRPPYVETKTVSKAFYLSPGSSVKIAINSGLPLDVEIVQTTGISELNVNLTIRGGGLSDYEAKSQLSRIGYNVELLEVNSGRYVLKVDIWSAGNGFSRFFSVAQYLTLKLPSNIVLDNVSVISPFIEARLSDLKCTCLLISSSTGDVEIDSCEVKCIELRLSVGDVSIKDTTASMMDVDVNIGDIKASVASRNCTFKVNIGDVNVKVVPLDSGCLKASVNIGDLKIVLRRLSGYGYRFNVNVKIGSYSIGFSDIKYISKGMLNAAAETENFQYAEYGFEVFASTSIGDVNIAEG